jgi:hypothetical protein
MLAPLGAQPMSRVTLTAAGIMELTVFIQLLMGKP